MKRISLALTSVFLLLFGTSLFAQQHYPGGVHGAETWYTVNYDNLDVEQYPNLAMPHIRISKCQPEAFDKSLFNFNHSIFSETLCLTYRSPLENSTSRNIFFVGELKDQTPEKTYSHVFSERAQEITSFDSIIRNHFILSTRKSFNNRNLADEYQGNNNANINFYHWNNYQSDRKFKSFGAKGETSIYIGKKYGGPELESLDFLGNFPEFISYPFELTANQKNRVESYLALKYGIAISRKESYRNSLNVVFWNKDNNLLFSERTFGIGRDDISGLNQLQSESVHNKEYLIASVEKLLDTNREKQAESEILNDHFIVFGDNNQLAEVLEPNSSKVQILKRIWLSQSTGKEADLINIHFKVNLHDQLRELLGNDSHLKLWLLHDKFVTNQNQSDFDNQYVDYHEAVSIDTNIDYGTFQDIYFDGDKNSYDQFTFGVGPKMIVQVRFDDQCAKDIKSQVLITGGTAPFTIKITNNSNTYSEVFETSENSIMFPAVADDTYTVYVQDASGYEVVTVVDVIYHEILVNLGPDQVLNAAQTQIILNAGQNVADPGATYQWFRNSIALNLYTSTLVVTEPGEYTVIVTSANRSCIVSDSIIIDYKFFGVIEPAVENCEITSASIKLELSGGIPPFTTILTSAGVPINQVHNSESYTFWNLPFADYTVTTTDFIGSIFQDTISLQEPLGGIETSVITQLFNLCTPFTYYGVIPNFTFLCDPDFPIFIDASQLVTNPNVSYEWMRNGQSIGINSPTVQIVQDSSQFPQSGNELDEYSIIIKNLDTGCKTSENFNLIRHYGIIPMAGNSITTTPAPAANSTQSEASKFITKVYPNPTDANSVFYYEISHPDIFNGLVQIYNPNGTLLHSVEIKGESEYKLSFDLRAAGVYFITTSTNGIRLTDRIIIK